MKKTFLIFTFFISISFLSQGQQEPTFPIDKETGEIIYTKIINVDSVSADILFIRAKEWFVHSFVSANNVLQLDDKESGKLIGKGTFDVYTSIFPVGANAGIIKFTIEIDVKNGKYKYKFSNIIHDKGISSIYTNGDLRQQNPGGGMMTMGIKNWIGIKNQTNDTFLKMINSLEKSMLTNKENDENW